MTDPRRDPVLEPQQEVSRDPGPGDAVGAADGPQPFDRDDDPPDQHPLMAPGEVGEDGGHRHVDFDTFMAEEGEDQGEHPGWARRRWSSAALVVAALVGALAVAVATWSWPESGASGDRLAEVELVGLSSTVGDAQATINDVDGRTMLRIDARDLPDVADGYAQVWVLDQALARYVPVGTLDAETTELWLPATLDLATYPIIEVSQEPFDGDPAHSGSTLWRGQVPSGGEPAGG